jgi:hypothetical protein
MNYVHGIFPFAPLCSPFPLTWNPPCCDRIRPPRSQVARKLTSPFPHLAHIPSHLKSRPPGFSRSKYTLIRTTLRTWPICSLTLTAPRKMHICNSFSINTVLYNTVYNDLICESSNAKNPYSVVALDAWVRTSLHSSLMLQVNCPSWKMLTLPLTLLS